MFPGQNATAFGNFRMIRSLKTGSLETQKNLSCRHGLLWNGFYRKKMNCGHGKMPHSREFRKQKNSC